PKGWAFRWPECKVRAAVPVFGRRRAHAAPSSQLASSGLAAPRHPGHEAGKHAPLDGAAAALKTRLEAGGLPLFLASARAGSNRRRPAKALWASRGKGLSAAVAGGDNARPA